MGRRTFLDDYVAVNAVGTMVIATASIAIAVINTEWVCPEEYVEKYRRLGGEPEVLHLLMQLMPRTTDLVEVQGAAISALVLQAMSFFSVLGNGRTTISTVAPGDESKGCAWEGERLASLVKNWKAPRIASCHITRPDEVLSNWYGVALCARMSYRMAFVFATGIMLMAILYLGMRCMAMLFKQHSGSARSGKIFVKTAHGSGFLYLMLSWCLMIMTVWDLTDHTEWEQWMWRDPWTERWWII